jgi:hypothetical protein
MKRFAIGYLAVLLAFAAANLISYSVRTDIPGAADAIRLAGFPFLVWEDGGFVYRHRFSYLALWGNIAVVAFLGLVAGALLRRVAR